MKIHQLPALSNNYVYVLEDLDSSTAGVIDPAEAAPVLQCLESSGCRLVAIFNTHHHEDHVGGNARLLNEFPDAVVYAGAEDWGRIPGQKVLLREGDRIAFGDRTAEVLFVPGHTKAHIAYYFTPQTPDEVGELFCGDTLFAGGCGRLFEGSPSQMVSSLTKLRALPEQTRVWCAHEYTLKNLEFALTVDGDNSVLKTRFADVMTMRRRSEPTVPSLLEVEKRTNPFLRWDQPSLQQAVKSQDPIQTFARLRGKKDQF